MQWLFDAIFGTYKGKTITTEQTEEGKWIADISGDEDFYNSYNNSPEDTEEEAISNAKDWINF